MESSALNFGYEESGDEEFAGGNPVAFNLLLDGKGALRRRSGISAYTPAPTGAISEYPITGLHVTEGGLIIATDERPGRRRIFRVEGGAALDISAPAGSDLRGTMRPTFAETEAVLGIAGGQEVQKLRLDVIGTPSSRLGGNPPKASHIVANASRFLVNRVETPLDQVNYCDPVTGLGLTGLETWSGTLSSGSFKSESRPDRIVALHETASDVWCFGATTTEVFSPDPSLVYARSGVRERGCASPYGVVKADETFWWIDERGRFIASEGRAAEEISEAIQRTIDGMTVSDAYGFRVRLDQFDVIGWTLPTSGVTMVKQQKGGWSRWGQWDGNWQPLGVTAVAYNRHDRTTIVGMSDGRIGKFDASAASDLGTTIKAFARSGFRNYKTDARKVCNCVRLTMTKASAARARVGTLKFRDEGGAWRTLPIAFTGTRAVVEFRSLGTYRRRQWEVELSSSEQVTLVSAVEDYTITGA